MKTSLLLSIVLGLVIWSFASASTSPQNMRLIDRGDGHAQWMTQSDAFRLSEEAHNDHTGGFNRCAGFFDLTDVITVKNRKALPLVEWFKLDLKDRPLTQSQYLSTALTQLDISRLQQTVTKLSSYPNRFHKNQTGIDSANWIADQFRAIAKNRTDIKVELFAHTQTKQPSVIVTMTGTTKPNEIVVLGGHEDSVHQGMFGPMAKADAPGADDNATGVATVLETFRVMVESGFRPDRTMKFMTYAAEEVGLWGSQDIANTFKNQSQNVVAVAQFDMTGFAGAGNQIVFMTDFVSPDLTVFSEKLVDTYVKVQWSNDKCGYACSDHASWTKAGYPSVMPFEATMSTDNKAIHSERDRIELVDFNHSLAFNKLALAFMAELSKDK